MTQWNSNYNGTTTPFSDTNANFALASGTALTYTVPGQTAQKYVMEINFNASANIFVGYNTAGLVPSAGTVTTPSNIEYRPTGKRYVVAGDVISLITPDTTAYAGLSLLAIPG